MDKQIRPDKVAIENLKITKLHRKCFQATFKMWFTDNPDLKIDIEYDAPTESRLILKIDHLKKTGIFLRD